MDGQSQSSRPSATLISYVYDERPTLVLMRALIRDARRWPELAIWDQSKDALISRSRSVGATQYMEQGAGDVLLMVDHDIGWEAGDLEHVTRVCLDQGGVVGGVYPKRGFEMGTPIRFEPGEYVIPSDRVVEVSAVGTGFIAIHRSVLAEMAATLPLTRQGFRPFFSTAVSGEDDGNEYESEDYAFCARARALGFKVWADLRPQLTHFGTHPYTVADTAWSPPLAPVTTLRTLDPDAPIDALCADGSVVQMLVDAGDQFVSGALLRGKDWEPEVVRALAEEILQSDTVVEVGAHIGYHTVQLASRAKTWIAVEPLPHLFELLEQNVSGHDNVICLPMAVAGEAGTRRMIRDWVNSGASYLLPEGDDSGIEVSTMTLPSICDHIDILKLDAEGAEGLILSAPGVKAALRDCRILVTEYSEAQLERVSGMTGEEYLALLEAIGFYVDVTIDELPRGAAYTNIVVRKIR